MALPWQNVDSYSQYLQTNLSVSSSMESLEPYAYQSLPKVESSFRVLELLPGDNDEEIFVNLHVANWVTPPPFEALSYAWGDPTIRTPVFCDGRILKVTINLRDALKQLRRRDNPRFLWVDAICIDQEGNLEEKSYQVSNMRKIYSNATRVIVWLGLDDNGLAKTAAHAMEGIAQSICNAKSRSVSHLREIGHLKILAMNSISWKELSCNTPEAWNSLCWFFSRPWFARVWVYQEVTSGPKVLFLCGEVELDWDIIGLNAEYITVSRSLLDTHGFWQSNIWCAVTYRDRRLLSDSCLDLLNSARGLKATQLVDKVYGLLGMPSLSGKNLGLTADYNKSVAKVYQDMGDAALASMQNLDLLAYVQHDQEISWHPSWIPRWDQAKLRHPLIRELRFQGAHNASQGLDFTYERNPEDTILKVPGIWFDTIEIETSIDNGAWFNQNHQPLNPHPVHEFWHEQNASLYPTGERLIDVYPKVLTTGFGKQADFSAYVLQLMKSSRLLVRDYTSIHKYISLYKQGKSGNWEYWVSTANGTAWGHSFFTTTKAYMGLGSQAMKAGDVVVILAGGEVPFILRRAGEFFQLVGECYVHGIMNGEAVHKVAERETFQIK